MTDSQERLKRNLKKLYGGKEPVRLWSLPELTNLLIDEMSKPNVSQLSRNGQPNDRTVFDSLHSAGFNITITNNGNSFVINW